MVKYQRITLIEREEIRDASIFQELEATIFPYAASGMKYSIGRSIITRNLHPQEQVILCFSPSIKSQLSLALMISLHLGQIISSIILPFL